MSTEDQDLKKELESIYTPLEEAKKEIWRRWNDKELRKKVDDFLKNSIPDFLKDSPRAILARFIFSPNFESFRFLKLSEEIKLDPICLEYLESDFVAENIDKYYLCKMYFHNGIGKNGGDKLGAIKIIDFDHSEDKKICELKTNWDESMVDFHHRLAGCSNLKNIDSFDFSKYLENNGKTASKYYLYFFSMLICYGVLFENYLLDDRQIQFTKNVILPNFEKILKTFGLKPLIVHLGPEGDEENLYWRYYPESLKDVIKINTNIIQK